MSSIEYITDTVTSTSGELYTTDTGSRNYTSRYGDRSTLEMEATHIARISSHSEEVSVAGISYMHNEKTSVALSDGI